MRMLAVTLLSSLLSALVISNAYMEKQQFYPTVVYLLSSNRSLGVLYLQSFVMVWFICRFLKSVFFGTLRAAEVEHLIESAWYAILETFILLAAFHQELSVSLVTMVTLLFVAKSFHWLAQDRVDFMERSPIITWLFHIRAVSLFTILLLVDYLFVKHSWSNLNSRGFSVDIVFGLEYAIMFLSALSSTMHYILHTIDRQSEDPWETKTIYIRIVDIVLGFFELSLYVGYMAFMLYVLFIPLHIARRVYVTAKSFQKSIYDVIASQQAIRHLNTLYPDATIEELEAVNNVCIICREEMVSRCKKLPCSHIFHTACLQSWFQRQQTCPTCRMDVLNRAVINRLTQVQGQAQQAQQAQAQNPRPPQPRFGGFVPPMMVPPPMMPPMWPHPPQPQAPQQQPDGAVAAAPQAGNNPADPAAAEGRTAAGSEAGALPNGTAPSAGVGAPLPPPTTNIQPPQFPMGSPGFPPGPFPFPPPPPPMSFMPGPGPLTGEALQSLSAEQLAQLEGMERANVEARIAVLRDVQKLLDSAVLRLNQYSAVMATISPPAGPGFPGYPLPPFSQPPQGNSAPPTSTSPPSDQGADQGTDQGTGQSATPTQEASTGARGPTQETSAEAKGGGLFQSQNIVAKESHGGGEHQLESSSSEEQGSGVSVLPAWAEKGGGGGSSSSSSSSSSSDGGVTPSSSSHVDSDIRQRRLARLHSQPSTSQQSLSPLVEREGELTEGNRKEQSRTGGGSDGETEV